MIVTVLAVYCLAKAVGVFLFAAVIIEGHSGLGHSGNDRVIDLT